MLNNILLDLKVAQRTRHLIWASSISSALQCDSIMQFVMILDSDFSILIEHTLVLWARLTSFLHIRVTTSQQASFWIAVEY